MFRFNNDLVSTAIWFASGVIITISSLGYEVGTLKAPGSGFMSFLAGLLISFFSLVGLIEAILRQRRGGSWEPILKGFMWGKSLLVLVGLTAYSLLLPTLGFILSTALFIGCMLRTVEPLKWIVVISGGAIAAIGGYVLFNVLLEAQLPKGPWGF